MDVGEKVIVVSKAIPESNSEFFGWLSMDNQSPNPVLRHNSENFHPCMKNS